MFSRALLLGSLASLINLASASVAAPPPAARSADAEEVSRALSSSIAPTPPRAWLGCTAVALAGSRADAPAVGGGVTITGVVPGGPAALAGLAKGDVIVALGEQPVLHPERLAATLGTLAPGARVRLVVIRDDATRVVPVTLAARPQDAAGSAAPRVLGRVFTRKDGAAGMALRFAGDRERAWLGVAALPLTDQLARFFGAERGVLLETVLDASPALAAGLQAGDVLVALAGTPVTSPTSLQEVLQAHRPDETVAVEIVRDGRLLRRDVVLAARTVPTWVFRPTDASSGDGPAAAPPAGMRVRVIEIEGEHGSDAPVRQRP